MKQYEAVILALERFGGQATLAQLYLETMKVPHVNWGTKTPFASIRRIVQQRPEIFKIRPGLWALESYRCKLGLPKHVSKAAAAEATSHSYYQGLLVTIGNIRGLATFIPHQDKNKACLQRPLGDLRSLQELPRFTFDDITRRVATIDVSWFNERRLPHSLFEIEHSTDMQNSLLKFHDLQDFSARMVIVAASSRKREFEDRRRQGAFRQIADRVSFYDYDALIRDFEHEALRSSTSFAL